MHSDYDSAIQVSFQPAAARPTSPEYSSLPGETIGGPKQEEDDHCSEGPTGSPANPVYNMVSSYNVWHSGFQPIVFQSEVYESSIFSVPGNVREACLLMEMAISNCKVQTIQKSLADQLVRHDTLQLRYSHIQVEKATSKLSAAELHIGQVHMVLRQNGYNPDIGKLYV